MVENIKLKRRQINRKYYVEYYVDGKRHRKSLGTDVMHEAVEKLKAFKADLEASDVLTLGDALDEVERTHWRYSKSYSKMKSIIGKVKADLGEIRLDKLTDGIIDEYVQSLRAQGNKTSTINRKLSIISRVLTDRKYKGVSPVSSLPFLKEPPRKERYLNSIERRMVLINRDYRLELMLLLDTGMRVGELLPLQLKDFEVNNEERLLIHLRGEKTKTAKPRTLMCTRRVQRALDYHLRLRRKETNDDGEAYVFDGLTYDALYKHWNMLKSRHPSLKDTTLHTLRHTCASRLVQSGVPLYTVSKWLGHSSIKTTEIYAHLAPDNMNACVNALE